MRTSAVSLVILAKHMSWCCGKSQILSCVRTDDLLPAQLYHHQFRVNTVLWRKTNRQTCSSGSQEISVCWCQYLSYSSPIWSIEAYRMLFQLQVMLIHSISWVRRFFSQVSYNCYYFTCKCNDKTVWNFLHSSYFRASGIDSWQQLGFDSQTHTWEGQRSFCKNVGK